MRRDVYQAIADPTRREILNQLVNRSRNINALADNFEISRQAISLQIKILEECGLVEIEKKGRERLCKARLQSLQDVAEWVGQFRAFWEDKLDALEQHIEKIQVSDQKKKK